MPSASGDTILSSPFRYSSRGFLWSRMRLFEDRIEFTGWGWTGKHARTVPLSRLRDLRWWTGDGATNFAMLLDDGERIYVKVEAAGLWKHEVEARATNLEPAEAKLPRTDAVKTPTQRARAA